MNRLIATFFLLCCIFVETIASNQDDALQTSVTHYNMKALHDLAKSTHSKQASLAVATASLQKKSSGSLHDILKHPSIVQRFNEVKKKAAAKTRLGIKAQTYASENVKSASDATEWMPFVLPPLGLCLLGGIAFAVVSIRKWQKIPSMPTQVFLMRCR